MMFSLLSQIGAVVRMNIASIPRRALMSIATIVAVAVAVGVFVGFGALANGFRQTLAGSGARDVAVVLRGGSGQELNSVLGRDAAAILSEAPGVARDAAGRPLLSGELYVIMNGVRRSNQAPANMPFRGLSAAGLAIRDYARIAKGRFFSPGSNEIVVGAGVVREFQGFDLGAKVRLRGADWKIVGIFDAPGTVFEGEIWADAPVVQGLFRRGASVQSLHVKLAKAADFDKFAAFAKADPRLEVDVARENDFYARQAQGLGNFIFFIGAPLGVIMAIGALAGALNTMYSSVEARAVETSTLRIIGFSGVAAFFGSMAEALMLSLLGAALGLAACYVLFNGLTASTLGGGFTQVVFKVQMSPSLVIEAAIIGLVIGLIGGLPPAVRSARQRPQLGLAG